MTDRWPISFFLGSFWPHQVRVISHSIILAALPMPECPCPNHSVTSGHSLNWGLADTFLMMNGHVSFLSLKWGESFVEPYIGHRFSRPDRISLCTLYDRFH